MSATGRPRRASTWMAIPIAFLFGAVLATALLVGFGGDAPTTARRPAGRPSAPAVAQFQAVPTRAERMLTEAERELAVARLQAVRSRRARGGYGRHTQAHSPRHAAARERGAANSHPLASSIAADKREHASQPKTQTRATSQPNANRHRHGQRAAARARERAAAKQRREREHGERREQRLAEHGEHTHTGGA